MKGAACFAFLAISVLCNAELKWGKDLEAAKKEATKTGKLIFIDFFTTWCGPCKVLDKQTFQSKEGQEILKKFVLLKLDAEREGLKLATQLKVNAYPTMYLLNGKGEPVLMTTGAIPPADLKEFTNEAIKRSQSKKQTPPPKKKKG
jgi:thiol:disulfide interchange protein